MLSGLHQDEIGRVLAGYAGRTLVGVIRPLGNEGSGEHRARQQLLARALEVPFGVVREHEGGGGERRNEGCVGWILRHKAMLVAQAKEQRDACPQRAKHGEGWQRRVRVGHELEHDHAKHGRRHRPLQPVEHSGRSLEKIASTHSHLASSYRSRVAADREGDGGAQHPSGTRQRLQQGGHHGEERRDAHGDPHFNRMPQAGVGKCTH